MLRFEPRFHYLILHLNGCFNDSDLIKSESNINAAQATKILERRNGPMKAFLEEYGVIVVAAIVIMIVVVFATPLGQELRKQITAAVTKVTDNLSTGLNVTDKGFGQN